MFVHLTFGQTLGDVIAGCEAAWAYFGGVYRVLIPDNLKPVVIDADPVNPRFSGTCQMDCVRGVASSV
jgi:transposase